MLPTPPIDSSNAVAPSRDDYAIRVDGVTKRFKRFQALNNITFSVRKGECVGIVGLNGAGKSTLLQIIAGTLPLSEGSVSSIGKVVALLELGTGFNDDYTGIENLYMNAALLGVPKKTIDQKLPEIESFAEIGDFINKPVKTYSSGMKVRLAFSMLTQIDPEIMIIDEALSVGDTYFAHKCSHLMRSFRQQGKTVLFVSHSEAMVKSLCDRAILLDQGTLIRDGTPSSILDYYSAMIAQKEREYEIQQIEKEKGRTVTRSGNGKATICRFELMDEHLVPRRKFDIGSNVAISSVIEANEDIAQPTIGFLIRDRFGNDIFGTNTFHHKLDTGILKKGERREVIFETQLNLGPGEYSLTLATHEGADHIESNYDWFDKLIVFNIFSKDENYFTGSAALPANIRISDVVSKLNRLYNYGDSIDFSDTGNSHRYTLHGWHRTELKHSWIDGKSAKLSLSLSSDSEKTALLTLRAIPFLTDSLSKQKLVIKANDIEILDTDLHNEQTIEAKIPAKIFKNSDRLILEIETPDAVKASDFTEGKDHRTLSVAFKSLILENQ